MQFDRNFVDELKARVKLSDIVGRKVRLIRRGREFVALSPFSNEKSPSFTINDDKGFYHCFATGEHGDIFGFVMKTENLAFPEAVEKLARDAGMVAWHGGVLANSVAAEALTSVLIAINKRYKIAGSGLRITGVPRT